MSTTIGVGFSQISGVQEATLQACVQVKNILNSTQTDLVIIFVSPRYADYEILHVIARSLKPKRLIGSSTGSIIFANHAMSEGIAIIGINSNEITFGISALADVQGQDMHYVGFDLSRKATQDLGLPQREMFICFAQGIEEDNVRFIQGIKETLGQAFPLAGAISSAQFFQDQISSHGAVGLLLGGKGFSVALDCRHGFKPVGKPRTITKIDEHTIRTIDHQPAIAIYKYFLSDKIDLKGHDLSSQTARYPLGILLEDKQYLLRHTLDILPDGSIVCQGSIPVAAEVHLMISNDDFCRQSAMEAAVSVKNALAGKDPKLILVLESWARHKIWGRTISAQIAAIQSILGDKTPLVGMSCWGEMAPLDSLNNIKNVYLQNGSILIIAMS